MLRMPGKTVEVVGLKRWTIPMIQDSLAKYSPGDSLHHHACAAVLRYKLGFANASSTTYMGMTPGDTSRYVVVTVVEPQDSARVWQKPAPMDTLNERAEWRDLTAVIKTRPGGFQGALWTYLEAGRTGFTDTIPSYMRRDSVQIRQVWRFLAAHRSAADQQQALATLSSDPNVMNRVAAAAILANFGADDTTWLALLDAMRETDGIAAGTSSVVLTTIAQNTPRTVDWTPATRTIHAILNGTSPFQLPALMQILPAGGLGPEWSKPFLADGGEMLLAYLAAEHPGLRRGAHHFLKTISGQDYGEDVQQWRVWIAGL